MHSESCFWIAPKWPNIKKMTMTSQFFVMTSSPIFVWCCFVSLFKFSNWSKFHVNIITGSGVMTIFFYKGLTRNPEIGSTPVWVLLNIWRLGKVRDTKFGTIVSNKMLLYATKCQRYRFYCFWVIKEKPIGGVKLSPPPRLRLNKEVLFLSAREIVVLKWRTSYRYLVFWLMT